VKKQTYTLQNLSKLIKRNQNLVVGNVSSVRVAYIERVKKSAEHDTKFCATRGFDTSKKNCAL